MLGISNQFRLWVETRPEVPEGYWYKDFRLFQSVRQRIVSKTFIVRGEFADSEAL